MLRTELHLRYLEPAARVLANVRSSPEEIRVKIGAPRMLPCGDSTRMGRLAAELDAVRRFWNPDRLP
jgi:hypothetical protein